MMETTNFDKLSDETSATTNVENEKNEHNLNSPIYLFDDNSQFCNQEKEIIVVGEIETNIMNSSDKNKIHISTNIAADHDYDIPVVNEATTSNQKSTKSSKNKILRYLPAWEKQPESFYKTYTFDIFNIRHEKLICWLYNKKDQNGYDSLGCKLCEKYQMKSNTNGKINLWCTTGYQILKLSKIKEHKDNEVHKQAQKLELEAASHSQPNWTTTQVKERSKHEAAVQNLILSSVYVCQQDQSINSFENLCTLLEAVGVKLLPAALAGVSYRNDCAALEFLRHVASYLHEEILEKLKKSPSIGWMLDESTSRSVEKSCIIYVRYIEDGEAKTSFYGILSLDGNGSADNIVESLKSLWRKDDLNPEKTCWFSTDNAATFTGVNNGVVVKLKRDFNLDFVELNTCVAHSFALVGSQAGYMKHNHDQKAKKRDLIVKLESIMGKIYQYFGSSANRTFKLKCWQNLLDIPELKFKRLFHIRWTSIRDSIKPIMSNISPTNQALLATLQEIKFDKNLTKDDREAAAELLRSTLDDEFLFMLHFHYDLHECVLGELTKLFQNDDLPYFTFMNVLNEKKQILKNWFSQKEESEYILGPSLNGYINCITNNGSYGAFQIVVSDRSKLYNECFLHIDRLLLEIDKRFKQSQVQQHFVVLFEPEYLIKNKDKVMTSNYGREELEHLRMKYKNLNEFNMDKCPNEWEVLKISLSEFVSNNQQKHSRRIFWKSFVTWKEAINDSFYEQFKNILILLSIYLISPLNSAECERGYSIANRIQTNGRSRIMIDTLDVLMNVRLLFPDDLRSDRSRQIIQEACNSWNATDEKRRINRTTLILDVPDDYVPTKQIRSNSSDKRKRQSVIIDVCSTKQKKKKANAIKCAHGCGKYIASDDPNEAYAIQCSHQNEYYDWVADNCSRWLCNTCRIKLGIAIESISWFCTDCVDMHDDEEQ